MLNKSLFQSIKDGLNKADEKSSSKDILRFEPGNTYVVRLLPNDKDPSNTFLKYYVHKWQSFATGQTVTAISPTTFGERDPISEERFRYIRTGSAEEKTKAESIRRQEKFACNVYVVEDSKTPENKGTVKIIRYGKQLEKIISAAMNEDADELGPKIFDLSPDGVNLKIKVEMQGDFPTFVSSRFTNSVDLGLSTNKIEEIYKSTHDVTSIVSIKSYDELKEFFTTHFAANAESKPTVKKTESKAKSAPVEQTETVGPDAELSESEVADLLKDLE